MNQYFVVFNIYEVAPDIFLPNAYIVKQNANGKQGYIEQKATSATIPSFNFNLSNDTIALIKKAETFTEQFLADKFNSKPKKKLALPDVLKQGDAVVKQIKSYTWKQMGDFLKAVFQSKVLLTYDLPRKEEAHAHKVYFHIKDIKPELNFKLKDYGVLYTLKLLEKDYRIKLLEKDIQVISNNPAWVKIDNNLFHIPHINGSMLKPFTQKDQLFIPQKTVKMYFETFILKVASKAEINAEGFKMIESKTLNGCKVDVIEDVFTGEWAIEPVLLYSNSTFFNWSDSRSQKLSLESKGDEIKIIKVIRNRPAEQEYISKLLTLGLVQSASGTFVLQNKPAKASFILHEWIINNASKLQELGIQTAKLSVNENEIYQYIPQIAYSVEEGNDWFDVYIMVKVGEYNIPFNQLVENIRNNDPIYILPNNKTLIIPEEWMTKYQQLSRFGSDQKKFLRYTKSQFTLLEDAGLVENQQAELDLDVLKNVLSNDINAQLRPYQIDGVHWMLNLYHKGLGGCLADDMGLGKTLQTICVLLYARAQKNSIKQDEVEANTQSQLNMFSGEDDNVNRLQAIIILPASLVYNWKQELLKFTNNLKICDHTGPKRSKTHESLLGCDVVLTTYHTALRDIDLLKQINWEYVVLDESQQIKNKNGKVFKSISMLEANNKLALSGTPIENSLSDLWSQMQFINPNLLGGYTFFKREFITPIEKKKSEEKKKQLYQMVNPYLLRRTKQQVAKDLPELTTKVFYSEMGKAQEKLYEAEKSMVRNYILNVFQPTSGKHHVHVLQSLIKLRQLANHTALAGYDTEPSGKFDDVIDQWNTITKSGHKILIFSSFVSYLELFKAHFDEVGSKYAFLHGGLTANQRKKQIDLFENNPDVNTFLISIKAGGTGLNLTAADYVFILDPWWNPFIEKQAIARAHRIGQTKSVVAVKFITKNSIEEKILKLQDKKTELAEDIIKDEPKEKLSKEVLEELVG